MIILRRHWVLKEATLKLTREGLSGDLKGISFINLKETDNVSLICKGKQRQTYSVMFSGIENHLGCVAINEQVDQIKIEEVCLNNKCEFH